MNMFRFHSLYGGMTTDYFEIFCKECGIPIDEIFWDSEDKAIGCKLHATCPKCGKKSIFKFKLFGVGPEIELSAADVQAPDPIFRMDMEF